MGRVLVGEILIDLGLEVIDVDYLVIGFRELGLEYK